jgi:hypothetical protein
VNKENSYLHYIFKTRLIHQSGERYKESVVVKIKTTFFREKELEHSSVVKEFLTTVLEKNTKQSIKS